MIKILTTHDFQACVDMVGVKPRTSGTTPVNKEDFIDTHYQYFNNLENRYALGYFEENTLICFLCLGFFVNNLRGKFWAIPSLYTTRFKNYFNFKDADTGELLKSAFEFAESKGYYEFYYSISERVMNVYERQWQRNSFMPVGRYELTTLDTVSANTRPEHDLYWKLMGNQLKPDNIVIKKRVLKEQFRNTAVINTDIKQ